MDLCALKSIFAKYREKIQEKPLKTLLALAGAIKLFINCFISLFYYLKFRPNYIITTGVHTAGPMCCIGKIFGSRIIYIETFANIRTKTITGRLLYPISDKFIVQWKSMLDIYPDAIYGGWIF